MTPLAWLRTAGGHPEAVDIAVARGSDAWHATTTSTVACHVHYRTANGNWHAVHLDGDAAEAMFAATVLAEIDAAVSGAL